MYVVWADGLWAHVGKATMSASTLDNAAIVLQILVDDKIVSALWCAYVRWKVREGKHSPSWLDWG